MPRKQLCNVMVSQLLPSDTSFLLHTWFIAFDMRENYTGTHFLVANAQYKSLHQLYNCFAFVQECICISNVLLFILATVSTLFGSVLDAS